MLGKRHVSPYTEKGIINLGNICYMSSVFQCLFAVKELTNYFLSEKHLNETNKIELGIVNAYYGYIKEKYGSNQGSINPILLISQIKKKLIQYDNCNPQDAQEFLINFFEALSTELSRSSYKNDKKATAYDKLKNIIEHNHINATIEDIQSKKAKEAEVVFSLMKKQINSIIIDLFFGQYCSIMFCQCCRLSTTNYESFSVHNLSLPEGKYEVTVLFFLLDEDYISAETFKATVFPKTTIKMLKDVLLPKYPLLTYEDIQSAIISSNRLLQHFILNDNYLIWTIYSEKKEIVFFQRPPEKKKQFFFYLRYNGQVSYPLRYVINDEHAILDLFIAEHIEKSLYSQFAIQIELNMDSPFYSILFGDYPDLHQLLNLSMKDYMDKYSHIVLYGKIVQAKSSLPEPIMRPMRITMENELSIEDCFKYSIIPNDLKNWNCTHCKKKNTVQKNMKISILPPYLFIQLGNYKNSGSKNVSITFKTSDMDLSKYVIARKPAKYELCAVIKHYMKGGLFGHFFTVARHFDGWMQYDDDKVERVDESSLQKNAYLLLFRRK